VIFPDFNIGYIFGYKSQIISEGFLITFLNGLVRIKFRFKNIEKIYKQTYSGGRISWDIIRWGKCPPGTKALNIALKKGLFKNNLLVFDNLDEAVEKLKRQGMNIVDA
jgi:hypothetical protein